MPEENPEYMPELQNGIAEQNEQAKLQGLKSTVHPDSLLEFQYMTVDPAHGKEISQGVFNFTGDRIGVLSILGQRDWRLSNFSGSELSEWRHIINMHIYSGVVSVRPGDSFPGFYVMLAGEAGAIAEGSQGRGGMLRKSLNTLRREQITSESPSQNKFMGGGKNE